MKGGVTFGGMAFNGGIIEEIRIDRDMVEVTTFGSSKAEFVPGRTHVTMRLRLHAPEDALRVMTALGAAAPDVATVEPVVAALGVRKVAFDE